MKFDFEGCYAPDGVEKLIRLFKGLYGRYGYAEYRMSKFEEYALYGGNIDFLVSDRVITFTDTDGKLMALKPDVTLSIVKNDRDDVESVRKVCYNENVYRVSKGSGAFREIMQSGIECIGDVDVCQIGEVLKIAAMSLDLAGGNFVLDVSSLEILSDSVSAISDDEQTKDNIMKCVGEKNVHGIEEIALASGGDASYLAALMNYSGGAEGVEEFLASLPLGEKAMSAKEKLVSALSVFDDSPYKDNIRIDFSVTADCNYYNGIVFKGFVENVPQSVLSGGQYDRLMKKMGRRSKAVGFAVYVDLLERINETQTDFDFDVMLVYSDKTSPRELSEKTEELVASGKSVFSCKTPDARVKCRETVRI